MGVVEEARSLGQLVYTFNQSKSPVLTQPGPWGSGTTGICAGLAIRWIKLRLFGRDFDYDRKTLQITNVDYRAVIRQNILDDTYGESGNTPMFQSAGLMRGEKAVSTKGRFILGQMKAVMETSGYSYIVLRGKGGAHAIAMETEPGCKVHRLFDANRGHFRYSWGAAMFKYWLYKYLDECGYIDEYGSSTVAYPIGLLLREYPNNPRARIAATGGSRSGLS